MKTLLFALLTMPFLSGVASASTIYTFTYHTVRGPIGFTVVSPQPLTQPSTYVNASMMASCETTGSPGWVCLDAYLRQTTVNGRSVVQVVMDIAYPPGQGDAFATDQLMDSFPDASLDSTGSYTGFLSPTTFTISQSVASSDGPVSPQLRQPRYQGPEQGSVPGNRSSRSADTTNGEKQPD